MSVKICLASDNPGKIGDIKNLFEARFGPTDFHLQKELDYYSPPPETGKTYAENAKIKAESLYSCVGPHAYVLADDTGLSVEGLDGKPGVMTARYAGPNATAQQNMQKLLQIMSVKPMPNRNAKFICSLYFISPDGTRSEFSGELEGEISREMRGRLGFGYDPIFIPKGEPKP